MSKAKYAFEKGTKENDFYGESFGFEMGCKKRRKR
jgi:hypothetical protein